MNKITKNQAQDLMEAYNSIYEPTDLTEEQIIEDFNLWVDSLLEEGYDLSDYTYEDLYEYYLSEGGWGSVIKSAIQTGLRTGFKLPYNIPVRQALVSRGIEGATRSGAQTTKTLKNLAVGSSAKNTGGKRRLALGLIGLDALLNQGKITGSIGSGAQQALKAMSGGSSSTAKPAPSKNPFLTAPESMIKREAYDWAKEKGKDWATLTRGGQTKIYVPGKGWQFPATINKERERAGASPVKDPGQPTRSTAPQSATTQSGQKVTPGKGYPETLGGARGYVVYDKSGNRKFTPYPTQPSQAGTQAPATPTGGTPSAPAAGASTPSPTGTAPASSAPAGGASKPAGGAPASSAPAGGASKPAGGAPASSPAASPSTPAAGAPRPTSATPARPQSPANLPTAEKIKSGMGVWGQQMKSGDTQGAAATGMNVWRMANPKLAAAADERARIRGTAQTDNPLMRSFRPRLSLTPSVQSPSFQSTMAGTSGQQSLVSNPNAAIAATPKPGPAATPIRPTVIPTANTPARPQQPAQRKPTPASTTLLKQSYENDAYDIILEYLIDRGHADSLDEANYIMLEMNEQSIQSIMEEYENYLLSVHISEWVDNLLDEGYDLSEYEWDDLVEYYISQAY